jgi:predicted GIY-YIG superfamily endonuclease
MKRVTCPVTTSKFHRAAPTLYKALRRIIYVLELAPEAAADPDFLRANPQYVDGMTCLYVGSSSRSAEQRFRAHLTGNNASRIAHQFAIKLRYDLMPPQTPIPKERALKEEKRLARTLRAAGFGVWQK